MTTLLKLGGSVITEKGDPETLDGPALDRVADEIGARSTTDLVLVHGGGSFGHHHADRHGVSTTTGTHDAGGALEIHTAMKTLNSFVLSRLHERNVPALPVHPLSAAHRDGDDTLSLPVGQVETMLAEGFVPVLHGDVVSHRGAGATIVSGDELMVSLAKSLDADRVGFLSTVPGVLDENDDVVPEIRSYDDVADVLGESEATDVTGGMAGKVSALLSLSTPAAIFGPNHLEEFLSGELPGTYIRTD